MFGFYNKKLGIQFQTVFKIQEINYFHYGIFFIRLGMIVVANLGYFESAKEDPNLQHWRDTLARFRLSADQDTAPEAVKEDLEVIQYDGPRMGPQLPLWYLPIN